jgi:hypothetical protein
MKSTGAKCIRALLALILLAAVLAPACAGAEDCSMPCCRQKAQPVSHPAEATPCCQQTTDASAGAGSGCRFEQHPLALPFLTETGPITVATVAAVVLETPVRPCPSTPAAGDADSSPPDTPLYLRLQILLI